MLHEAPHKLRATLADLCELLGEERRIALCRELTKKNEEILRTTLGEACAIHETREPRGEYVLVIEGGSDVQPKEELTLSPEERVARYMDQGMRKNDAIKAAAKDCGLSRGELYDRMVENK